MGLIFPAILGITAILVALLWAPVKTTLTVVGVTRPQSKIVNIHGAEGKLTVIPNTLQCEDLHYHQPSGLLFAGCQSGDSGDRYKWFPPLQQFADPQAARGGGIYVIDPKTLKSTRLTIPNFSKPFVTHGIDILSSPDDPDTVAILAVNHVPNPAHFTSASSTTQRDSNKALSRVELFHHVLGTTTASHARTIIHPSIRTPNDVLLTSPSSFYVSNDHYFREGFLRQAEDLLPPPVAKWSDVQHIAITGLAASDSSKGISNATAVQREHYPNGLGRASSTRPHEVLLLDASGGIIHRATRHVLDDEQLLAATKESARRAPGDTVEALKLNIFDSIQLDCTIDNPSWFDDVYATPGNNASGYVIGGLARAFEFGSKWKDRSRPIPVMAFHVRENTTATPPKKEEAVTDEQSGITEVSHNTWEKRLIFQDDGTSVRSASSAVIVGIDPEENGGKKQGWLFVTGFLSEGISVTKIDL